MIEIETYSVRDVVSVTPRKFGDSRGFFSETFREDWFEQLFPGLRFRQDNHAYSQAQGTLRGLHFQFGEAVQAKLVRCTKGAILDVAVDLRRGSPSYGQHVAVELSAENWRQLLIPHGFAHGYCTLTEDAEVLYKVDNFYDSEKEGSISWSDPDLKIDWLYPRDRISTSDKDAAAPRFADSPDYFAYQPGEGRFDTVSYPAAQHRGN